MAQLSNSSYAQIKVLLERWTGIQLADYKRHAVSNRLLGRLAALKLDSFEEYLVYLNGQNSEKEVQIFVDKLTTHETYFFREQEQFDWLENYLDNQTIRDRTFTVWSAACASGEEAYSLAMLLNDSLGEEGWNVFGTDISLPAVEMARNALYPLERVERIPREFRLKYCLKGVGKNEGMFTFCDEIKQRCFFSHASLLDDVQDSSIQYDVIFLRNILIYFSPLKQKRMVNKVLDRLEVGGLLFLGHSENIVKDHEMLKPVGRCIYQRIEL